MAVSGFFCIFVGILTENNCDMKSFSTFRNVLVLCLLCMTSLVAQGQEKSGGPVYVEGPQIKVDVRHLKWSDFEGIQPRRTALTRGDETPSRWIDRIGNMPDYLIDFYQLYGTKVQEVMDGQENWLSNPEKAEFNSGAYHVTVKTINGSTDFTFPAGSSNDVIQEAAGNAVQEKCGNTINEYTCFMNYLTLCMNYDYPEAFWTGNAANWSNMWGYNYSYDPSAGSGTINYTLTLTFVLKGNDFDYRIPEFRDPTTLSSAVTEFNTKVNSITESYKSKTRYEQVSGLNDWLTKHNSYNSDLLQTGKAADIAWSSMSALRESTGALGPVCEGYARAFKCLCDKLSIPCILANGNAKSSKSGTGEAHMWNEVQMENSNWYAVDVTWNDPIMAGADNNQKVSGGESDFWLLLGQNDEVAPGFTFAESHPNSPAGDNPYKSQWELLFASLITDTRYEPGGSPVEVITFADANVKAICVEKWDTNGDGELSYDEAAAVTDLDKAFYNKRISTFNELQYFTGLKAIGPMAFHFSDITSVKLPSSVTEIGDGAFDETGIVSIDGGVTKNDLVIPDHITTLRFEAFACNGGIYSVKIPASVTLIEPYVFRNCIDLKSFSVDKDNPVYKMADGWLIENGTTLHSCPILQEAEKLVVSEGIKEIARYAATMYSIKGLKEVVLPSTLKKIGASAFGRLEKIICNATEPAELVIEGSEEKYWYPFDEETFEIATLYVPLGSKEKYMAAEGWKKFKNIVEIEEQPELNDGDWFMGKTAEGLDMNFQVISAKEKTCQVGIGNMDVPAISKETTGKLTIPAEVNGYKVTMISTGAIYRCYGITELIISEGIESLMDNSIEFCDGLTSIVLPASVTYLSETFGGFGKNIQSISVEEENPVYDSRNGCNAIIETANNTIRCGCVNTVIPESVTAIGAWSMCRKGLTNIVIPEQITYIGAGALRYNDYTEITIPSGVKEIGWSAFDGCKTLEKVTILPEKCRVESAAFWDNVNLKKVISYIKQPEATNGNIITSTIENTVAKDVILYVPEGTKALYEATNGWNNLNNIVESITSESAVYAKNEDNSLSIGDVSETSERVEIPSSVIVAGEELAVTTIAESAFENNTTILKVTIPETISEIGENAFAGCRNLKEIRVFAEEPIKLGSSTASGTRGSGASSVFAEVDMETCVLYVPAGSKEKYEQAEGWSDFKNIVEMGETAAITIGKSGKASYCGDKSLDFGYSDKVKAYIATGFDKDEGTIWLTRVKDVPAGVPVLIKGEANKTYDVPVTDSQNSYYTNMFVGNTTGEKMVIQETDGDLVNYYLSGDGTFKSVNKSANIGNNKCYLQLPGTYEAAATGATQTVKVGSIGKASFAAPVDLDFTNVSGLKAFTATGYDKSTKTIWLTRVMKVQKGEGVLLKGDPNSYEIPSVAVQSSYENMFVGNTSGDEIQVQEMSADGSQTNYYLSGKDGSFVSVSGYAKIGNNKCYLALPTSMVAVSSTRSAEDSYKFEEPEVIKLPIDFKSIGSEGDGTTSIREVKSGEAKSDEWFTLQGQRVAKPGKGLYIKNGKVVIVR